MFAAPAPETDGRATLTQAKLANLQAALGDAYREAGEIGEAIDGLPQGARSLPGLPRRPLPARGRAARARPARSGDPRVRARAARNPAYLDASVQLGLTYWSLGQAERAAAEWQGVALGPSRLAKMPGST